MSTNDVPPSEDGGEASTRTGWSNRTLGWLLAGAVILWFLFAIVYIWWY